MQPPDTVPYLVYVDHLLHTDAKPFCFDETCDCHDDDVAVYQVSLYIQDGLMTPEEATEFVKGRGI
jgi:hypothetical protein